jgi:hypothetical protein
MATKPSKKTDNADVVVQDEKLITANTNSQTLIVKETVDAFISAQNTADDTVLKTRH